MEAQTKVRITIWQPYFLGCMLALGQIDAIELDVLESDTELQREVFTWPVQEDVWAGIVDDEVRSTLQERFVTDFQPVKLPEQRSMASFAEFVDRIGAVVAAGGSEWSVGASGVADRSTSASCMTNSLLAFHQQLEWLLDMFRDVPGASVSVR